MKVTRRRAAGTVNRCREKIGELSEENGQLNEENDRLYADNTALLEILQKEKQKNNCLVFALYVLALVILIFLPLFFIHQSSSNKIQTDVLELQIQVSNLEKVTRNYEGKLRQYEKELAALWLAFLNLYEGGSFFGSGQSSPDAPYQVINAEILLEMARVWSNDPFSIIDDQIYFKSDELCSLLQALEVSPLTPDMADKVAQFWDLYYQTEGMIPASKENLEFLAAFEENMFAYLDELSSIEPELGPSPLPEFEIEVGPATFVST